MLYVSEMPTSIEKRLKKYFNFLWGDKPAKIAYSTIIGTVRKGGLGLMDIEQRKNAMRIKVVNRYLQDKEKYCEVFFK